MERDSTVNLEILRPLLPDMYLEVRAGQDNPIYNYLQTYYVDFKSIAMNAYTSPETGIRMDASIYDLARDTMQIDTIRAEMHQDSLGLLYNAQVIKNKYRQQQPFSAGLDGQIRYGFGDARLYFKDGKGETGLLLGIRADKIQNGVKFHLFPDDPIIAFRPFKLNPDNYVVVRSMKDIEANLRLSGDNNAALWIHSQAESDEMEEVHAELNQIDLGVISNAFSYIPPMKGILNADFQYAPSDSAFMVVADMNIDDLYYENERVGELMFNAVYLPLEQGNHQVDMHLFRDRKEVSAITALYQMGETDHISGNIEFMHFPLDIANPFIPDDMAKMGGDLDGTLAISGQSDKPMTEGYLILDTASANYSDGSGQQFITLVSKSGATFYLVIDRNAKGQQTVHFMNLVDEADLLALMEEDVADAYTAEKEAAAQAEQERKQAEEDAKKAAEEAAASGTEQTGGNKVTKYAATFLGVLALVGLAAGGGIYTFMKQKQKKQAEKEALDPDANYTEDKGDFEIPVEDEPEEVGEEDNAEE